MTARGEGGGDLWVFGYGSLMWRPGFDYLERHQARIAGYHRAFCVYSHVHRGTPERPGLVLGLSPGGSCRGMIYRVDAAKADETVEYLRAREQVTEVYREARVAALRLPDGQRITGALTYVVDPSHEQFAGRLDFETQVRLIARGVGQSGANPDYLEGTVMHLREMGIRDRGLESLHDAVQGAVQGAKG